MAVNPAGIGLLNALGLFAGRRTLTPISKSFVDGDRPECQQLIIQIITEFRQKNYFHCDHLCFSSSSIENTERRQKKPKTRNRCHRGMFAELSRLAQTKP
jgi:hypothetical protein